MLIYYLTYSVALFSPQVLLFIIMKACDPISPWTWFFFSSLPPSNQLAFFLFSWRLECKFKKQNFKARIFQKGFTSIHRVFENKQKSVRSYYSYRKRSHMSNKCRIYKAKKLYLDPPHDFSSKSKNLQNCAKRNEI